MGARSERPGRDGEPIPTASLGIDDRFELTAAVRDAIACRFSATHRRA